MADKDDGNAKEEKKKGKPKALIMGLPVVLLLAGAGWFFFLRGGGEEEKEVTLPPPVPGEVVTLDAITVNLANGHFLKLGLALQADASATELDGSKALDLAIAEFSGKSLSELASPAGRVAAKRELVARVKLAYLPEDEKGEEARQAALHEATSAEESQDEENSKKSKKKSSSESESSDEEEGEEEIDAGQLNSKQVIAAAEALTVSPMIYDVYFTQFVMQ